MLIVSEVRLYADGLALILGREGGRVRPIGHAADIAEAVEAVREQRPDVVLLDGAGADGARVVAAIMASDPGARVVVHAAVERDSEVIAYAEAGVSGYVPRSADAATLVETIEAVDRGDTLCSPHLAAVLLRRVALLATERSRGHVRSSLTLRELEVVGLIERGLSNKEIALSLGIEVATVKNHVHNILDKLGVRRRSDAVAALRR